MLVPAEKNNRKAKKE
jgi:hypothetical protein